MFFQSTFSCTLWRTHSLTPFDVQIQVVFSLCPLTILEWWAVLKISVPVILLDEVLKFVARTFIDGNHPAKAESSHPSSSSSSTSFSSSTCKDLLLLIFVWIAYFVVLIATSKELIGDSCYLPKWLSPIY